MAKSDPLGSRPPPQEKAEGLFRTPSGSTGVSLSRPKAALHRAGSVPGRRTIPWTGIRSRRDKNCFQISVSALLICLAGVKTVVGPSMAVCPGAWEASAGLGGLRGEAEVLHRACRGLSAAGISVCPAFTPELSET